MMGRDQHAGQSVVANWVAGELANIAAAEDGFVKAAFQGVGEFVAISLQGGFRWHEVEDLLRADVAWTRPPAFKIWNSDPHPPRCNASASPYQGGATGTRLIKKRLFLRR